MAEEAGGGVVYNVDIDLSGLDGFMSAVDSTNKKAQKSFGDIDRASNATGNSMNRLSKTSEAVSKSFQLQKGSAQQLSWQLQDVVVQAQMGTSWFTIIGQQAPQILSLAGAGGALLGVFAALGAAAGGVLYKAFSDSTSSAENLEKAMEELRNTATMTDDGIAVLSDRLVKLAQVSERAALAEATAGIIKAEKAARGAATAIGDLFDAGRLQFAVDVLTSGVSSIAGIPLEVRGVARSIGESLGQAGDAAVNAGYEVIQLYAQIQKAPTPENFLNLQNYLSEFAITAGKTKPQVTELISSMAEFFAQGRTAAESVQFLNETIGRFGQAVSESDENTRKAKTTLESFIQSLTDQAATVGMTERGIALYTAEQLKATDADIRSINVAFDIIEAEKAKQEAIKKSTEEKKAYLKSVEDAFIAEIKAEQDQRRTVTTEFQQVQTGITSDLESPAQKADRELSERLAVIRNYAQQEYADKEAALELQLQAEQAHAERLKAIREEDSRNRMTINTGTLSAASDFFGNLASIAEQGGKDQFSAWKFLASAQAGISAALAVLNVLANPMIPYPLNVGLAGSMAALAGAQVAQIQSAQYSGSGRLYGGPVSGGKLYPFMEDGKPEAVEMGGATYLWTGGKSGNVISNKDLTSGGGGTGVNVSVIVENYGSDKVSVSREQGRGVTSEEVIKIVVGNINERGQVHSAITRSTTAGNRT